MSPEDLSLHRGSAKTKEGKLIVKQLINQNTSVFGEQGGTWTINTQVYGDRTPFHQLANNQDKLLVYLAIIPVSLDMNFIKQIKHSSLLLSHGKFIIPFFYSRWRGEKKKHKGKHILAAWPVLQRNPGVKGNTFVLCIKYVRSTRSESSNTHLAERRDAALRIILP